MRSATLVLALALALLARTFPAEAAGGPLLNPAVIVKGDIVRLGDLFTNLPADKVQLPAAYAPRPGERIVLDAERLLDIARVQGLAWMPQSRFDRSIIERASRLVERTQIMDLVGAELRKSGIGKDDQIVLDNENLRLHISADVDSPLRLRDMRYDPQSHRFAAVLIADPSAVDAVVPIAGRVIRMIEVPVPARQLNRDDVIGKRDIQWVHMAADRLDSTILTDESRLIGQAPNRLLRPGDPVRASDVHPPILVSRGALVTMVYQTAYMIITARGKAVQDGARGETIRVVNLQSKRELEGTVTSPDTVVVQAAESLSLPQALN